MPSKMLKSSRKQKILSISDERVTKNNSAKCSIPTHSTTMDKVRYAFRVIQSFLTIKTVLVSYQLVQFFKLCFPDITTQVIWRRQEKKQKSKENLGVKDVCLFSSFLDWCLP